MTNQDTYEWRRFFAAVVLTVVVLTLIVTAFFATLGDDSSTSDGPYSEYTTSEQAYLEDTVRLPVVSDDPDVLLGLGYATCDFLADGYSRNDATVIVYDAQVRNTSFEDYRLAQALVNKAIEHLC